MSVVKLRIVNHDSLGDLVTFVPFGHGTSETTEGAVIYEEREVVVVVTGQNMITLSVHIKHVEVRIDRVSDYCQLTHVAGEL